ncbi:MAG: hypothetical protein O7H41_00940 [Planctomycetota bacterium]|nr:hypothetical protein [Planctomycetota bacterium]
MSREFRKMFRGLLGGRAPIDTAALQDANGNGKNGTNGSNGSNGTASRMRPAPLPDATKPLPSPNGSTEKALVAIRLELERQGAMGKDLAVISRGVSRVLERQESADVARRMHLELTWGLATQVAMQQEGLSVCQAESAELTGIVRNLIEMQLTCLISLKDGVRSICEKEDRARSKAMTEYNRRSRRSDFLAILVACGTLALLSAGALVIFTG